MTAAEAIRKLCSVCHFLQSSSLLSQGAIIVVSHDEAFVNKLLTGSLDGLGAREPGAAALKGELWVLEQQQFRRFEGTFRQYKKKVLQAVKKELRF